MGSRHVAALLGIVLGLALLAPDAGAAAAPVLLPPHVLGPVPDDATETLTRSLLEEITTRGGGPVEALAGDSCPDPLDCEAAEGTGSPRYWLQISGDDRTLVAVALRLDGAEEAARATAEGPPADAAALGTSLGADVAAGFATGLTVDAGLRRATVSLDGDVVGQTPLVLERPIPAGHHVVRVEARDGRLALALVLARAGEIAELHLDLSTLPRPTAEALAGRTPTVAPRKGPGAWPLLPVAIGAAVAGVLFATDPAGLFAPDYTITVVPP